MDALGLSIVKWLLLILSIVGTIISFTIHSSQFHTLILVTYIMVVVYITFVVICTILNRSIIPTRIQAFIEIILGVVVLVVTIYVAADSSKEAEIILILIIGFILAPLLFISACEK